MPSRERARRLVKDAGERRRAQCRYFRRESKCTEPAVRCLAACFKIQPVAAIGKCKLRCPEAQESGPACQGRGGEVPRAMPLLQARVEVTNQLPVVCWLPVFLVCLQKQRIRCLQVELSRKERCIGGLRSGGCGPQVLRERRCCRRALCWLLCSEGPSLKVPWPVVLAVSFLKQQETERLMSLASLGA